VNHVTRRKGEYSKRRLDREFAHQVTLPADRCTGAKGAAMNTFCTNLGLGPGHHSLFYEDHTGTWFTASPMWRTPTFFGRTSAARPSIPTRAGGAESGNC
jgi:hypothetical protein